MKTFFFGGNAEKQHIYTQHGFCIVTRPAILDNNWKTVVCITVYVWTIIFVLPSSEMHSFIINEDI